MLPKNLAKVAVSFGIIGALLDSPAISGDGFRELTLVGKRIAQEEGRLGPIRPQFERSTAGRDRLVQPALEEKVSAQVVVSGGVIGFQSEGFTESNKCLADSAFLAQSQTEVEPDSRTVRPQGLRHGQEADRLIVLRRLASLQGLTQAEIDPEVCWIHLLRPPQQRHGRRERAALTEGEVEHE